ncbi:hypothetical protein HELRODRAFT_70939, partial [Helobdella robusta]|uniref:Protein kinase domain-containing protein n=1 Tax=Helobdella robusta TaxID=6412 RepID=T1G0E6_HELRO
SLFIFEKKVAEKLHKPKRREMVAELLRRDLDNMGKVRHNKVIKMLHPVEECNSSIAFASEPIRASLTNLMGNYDKLPLAVQMDLKVHYNKLRL